MERKTRTVATSVKIPENLLKIIEQDIETTGDHANRTDWIVAAIRKYAEFRMDFMYKQKVVFENNDDSDKG